jgi:membrane-bound inhibitor of C-type lysozyme
LVKKFLCCATLFVVSACVTPPPSGPSDRHDWSCGGGAAFSVRFSATAARIFAGGQIYDLPSVPAASGTRYSNGTVEYWEHQGEATLANAAGGPYAGCRQAAN